MPVPAGSARHPQEDLAEPIGEAGGISVKARLRKGKTQHGGKEKRERNSPVRPAPRPEKKAGRRCSRRRSRFPCSSWRDQAEASSPDRNCSPQRARAGVGEKCEEEEGVVERKCYILTAVPHSPPPGRSGEGRGVGNEGAKLNLGKGVGRVVLVLAFVSHHPMLFQLLIN